MTPVTAVGPAKPRRFEHFSDADLQACIRGDRSGLKAAHEGMFDDIWKKCPDIDGRPQREIFITTVAARLPLLEAEAKARGYDLEKFVEGDGKWQIFKGLTKQVIAKGELA